MTKNWNYGDAWEDYPIVEGTLWAEQNTSSMVQVIDLFDGLPDFMLEADMVYVDPPWNTGMLNGFYTKAGSSIRRQMVPFLDAMFGHIQAIDPIVCFVEIGKQGVQDMCSRVEKLFRFMEVWEVTYYKRHPSFLVRGGQEPSEFDYSGMDDEDTPGKAVETELPSCVADLCTGVGCTAEVVIKARKRFVGTELNKRRLACAIQQTTEKHGCIWRPQS